MDFSVMIKPLRYVAGIVAGGFLATTLVSCGGGGGSAGTVTGSAATVTAGSVSLIFSNPELKSDGATGSEVTVTALVKTKDNNALAGVPVKFTADSGALAVADSVSDKNGQAKAVLSTSGDRTNRTITITVQATGAPVASGTVNVVGSSVVAAGPTAITAGSTGDFTVTVKDSAGTAVAGVPVTYSSVKGHAITVKTSAGGTGTAPLTNAQGQVVLTLTASQSGTDTLTFSSQGTTTLATVSVTAATLTVAADSSGGDPQINTSCVRITANYAISGVPQGGTVNISTSRGAIYSDASCASALTSSSVALVGGVSQPAYIKSDTPGVATVTAAISNGPSAQTSVEFVAALTSSATISIQADPAVIGANSGTGQSEASTITAIVRDGTTKNNVVKNAVVEFSIVTDKSGGKLSSPAVVTTASNGSATVSYIAGTADTEANGVVIQAKIQGTTKTATTALTVSHKSLFISAGTGNTIETPSSTTYRMNFSVFVSDSSGNAVPNVTVTASALPTRYRKGSYTFDSDPATPENGWYNPNFANGLYVCANEDVNANGILDSGEDTNQSLVLEPGIPFSVTSSGKTDATGTAAISILYPRDRANWVDLKLTIRGSVTGTESTYTTTFTLPGLATDFSSATTAPPGQPSPYGVNFCSLPN